VIYIVSGLTTLGRHGNVSWEYAVDVKVSCVAVGAYHTVCGTENGDLYCWGDNSKCQCGSVEAKQFRLPVCIQSYRVPVIKVSQLIFIFTMHVGLYWITHALWGTTPDYCMIVCQ